MIKAFNGNRLKEARLFNKMTITELAEYLDVSKQMISKYENDKSEPSFEKSLQLYKILNYPREFFYSTDTFNFKSEGTFFRAKMTATQKSKVPANFLVKYAVVIRDYLENYIEFPTLQNRSIFENQNAKEITRNIRSLLNLKENPIEDIIEVAELLGMTVVKFSYEEDKIDAFSSMCIINDTEYFVIVTGDPGSFYRQQFSLAHEIGHWALHQGINPQDLDKDEYKIIEEEANNFASMLLLPEDTFKKDIIRHGVSFNSFLTLKKKWNVSIAAMILRARDLNLISATEQTKLYKHMQYRGFRNPEPFDLDTKITEPLAFRQSLELLVDQNVKAGYEIRKDIANSYNLFLTKAQLSQVCNVPESFFDEQHNSNIIIKLKDSSLHYNKN